MVRNGEYLSWMLNSSSPGGFLTPICSLRLPGANVPEDISILYFSRLPILRHAFSFPRIARSKCREVSILSRVAAEGGKSNGSA